MYAAVRTSLRSPYPPASLRLLFPEPQTSLSSVYMARMIFVQVRSLYELRP